MSTTPVFVDPHPAPLSIYIHIPFCDKRCTYCDFATFTGRQDDIPAYLDGLRWEMTRRASGRLWPSVATIFFGGGTPSLLNPEQVYAVLAHLRDLFDVQPRSEVTLEANPGTIDRSGDALVALQQAGINRLSFGVQTLDDPTLRVIGRIHSADEARQALRMARASGYDELNADLIYGLPGQTVAAWDTTLRSLLQEDLDHLSLYALTPERGTPLYRALGRKEITIPPSDDLADMYDIASDVLATHGYNQYEISNWARAGHESRHNTAYWRHTPYFGFGVGAHGYIDGYRVANVRGLDSYLQRIAAQRDPAVRREPIGLARARSDALILGLRLTEGIDLAEYAERFGCDPRDVWGGDIARLCDEGLLQVVSDPGTAPRLRLAPRAYLVANYVWQHFV